MVEVLREQIQGLKDQIQEMRQLHAAQAKGWVEDLKGARRIAYSALSVATAAIGALVAVAAGAL